MSILYFRVGWSVISETTALTSCPQGVRPDRRSSNPGQVLGVVWLGDSLRLRFLVQVGSDVEIVSSRVPGRRAGRVSWSPERVCILSVVPRDLNGVRHASGAAGQRPDAPTVCDTPRRRGHAKLLRSLPVGQTAPDKPLRLAVRPFRYREHEGMASSEMMAPSSNPWLFRQRPHFRALASTVRPTQLRKMLAAVEGVIQADNAETVLASACPKRSISA